MSHELLILTASRPITDLGYNGMLAAVIALVHLEGKSKHTFRFRDCEIHLERTGKTGVLGSFAGEEFVAHYADDVGTDVRAKFIANVRRLQLQAEERAYLN